MGQSKSITVDALRSVLRYEEGKLFWLARGIDMFSHCKNPSRHCDTWNAKFAGKEAFTADDGGGYRRGTIFGRHYRAHQVVWALVHGVWAKVIDHVDHDKSNNDIHNLRSVSAKENARNLGVSAANTSGVVGVSFLKASDKWKAQIKISGRTIHLGEFVEKFDAILARLNAERTYGFHINHGRVA